MQIHPANRPLLTPHSHRKVEHHRRSVTARLPLFSVRDSDNQLATKSCDSQILLPRRDPGFTPDNRTPSAIRTVDHRCEVNRLRVGVRAGEPRHASL
jgi:hypothetical protein